jgi:hypothetical protein
MKIYVGGHKTILRNTCLNTTTSESIFPDL